nr:hypothetical protein [Actinomycetota bacterium]
MTDIEIESEQSNAYTQAYPPEAIPALAALLDALRERGVRYCLWKSNLRLAHALTGQTDLDLLIDRRDSGAFREVLVHHPVKPMVPSPHATYPGMHHLLGFDSATGQLFHLHVHYQMVLGEQYVKNHRFPMEQDFLGSIRVLDGVPVPSAALELAILAVRALLKYRARDVVKDVLNIRTPGLAADIRNEIGWLLQQTSVEEVRAELNAAEAPLPVESICDFLEIAQGAPRSGYKLLRLRGRLRRTVEGMQRGGRLPARATYLRAAWRNRRRFRRGRSDYYAMSPVGGGFGVALIG